jgi:hypothetical protein
MNEPASGAQAALKKAKQKKLLMYGVGALAVVFLGMQVVPVAGKDNPPVIADFEESKEVEDILRRACYDCHSHEVRWPWYASLAPASWLLASDVVEGRKAFNFSDWPEDEDDRQFAREQALEQVQDGEMPPWFYTPMHPEANLTAADMAILEKWGAEKEEEEEEPKKADDEGAEKEDEGAEKEDGE